MKKLVVSLSLCVSSAASAQISFPNIQVSDFPDPVINADVGSTGPAVARKERSKPDAGANILLAYVPNKSRTPANIKNFLERNRAADPANADQIEQMLSSTDVIGAVGDIMDQFGLKRNNVAHAYALYWVVYWGLANKVYDAPPTATMQAVAAQAELGFVSSPHFVGMGDAEKQAATEELMLLTAVFDTISEQAKSDPSLAERAAKASVEGSRKSGLDLDAMTLTEDGFVPAKGRKRSDASDVVGEGEEKALAANDVGDEKDIGLSATQLALIAAAGGAGLAGVFLFGKAMGKKG
jgi:hypothetical protein